jgi:LuxR family transcriptional regulator, maltose regulon positive regulatory protein
LQRGELRLAGRVSHEVLHTATELGAPPHDLGITLATLVGAALDLEAGKLESADRQLRAAETAAQTDGKPGLQGLVSLGFARLATARGHEAAASTYLTEARFVFRAPSASVRAVFAVEALRQAAAFVSEPETGLLSALPDRADTRLLRARLAVAHGDATAAAALLAGLDAAQTTRERVERGVLGALVAIDRDANTAHAHLRETLRVARSEGFYRTVLEQGSGVSDLLRSFPPEGALAAYVEELLAMADAAPAPLRPGAVNGFVEQLSPREVAVLRYLPSRLTNQEIAAQLFVSMNTLKTHQKRIYRKLGANSRRDAVDIARASKLI